MHVWWRDNPLSLSESELLTNIRIGHRQAAMRDNASSCAVQASALGSGSYFSAIIAGLAMFGERHGPIERTYRFLKSWPVEINADEIVPGWGSSFHKGHDPQFTHARATLKEKFPEMWQRMEEISLAIGHKALPNPSAYTAAAAIIMGLPEQAAGYLLVASRLDAWSEIFNNAYKEVPWVGVQQ